MLPGFFLDIADNTGDDFSYEILPVKDIGNIPIQRNPVNLVRSVVRSRDIASNDTPSCQVTPIGFQIYNKYRIELFALEEDEASHTDLPVGTPIQPYPPCGSPISQFYQSNETIVEIDIDGPLSRSNILFREEQDNNSKLLPSSEEHPHSTSLPDVDNVTTTPSP